MKLTEKIAKVLENTNIHLSSNKENDLIKNIINMLTSNEMQKIYLVKSALTGEYYKGKGVWVKDISKAKVYANTRAPKCVISFYLNNSKELPPELVEAYISVIQPVLDYNTKAMTNALNKKINGYNKERTALNKTLDKLKYNLDKIDNDITNNFSSLSAKEKNIILVNRTETNRQINIIVNAIFNVSKKIDLLNK